MRKTPNYFAVGKYLSNIILMKLRPNCILKSDLYRSIAILLLVQKVHVIFKGMPVISFFVCNKYLLSARFSMMDNSLFVNNICFTRYLKMWNDRSLSGVEIMKLSDIVILILLQINVLALLQFKR